ncbi:hypothetical protein AMAG_11829 [Allomyces macrogynus ATCC 38327]|uniref:Uncharacterized protein n=1 Tax=Allomyces macrogynus (strain ATCC 38327) TaxID=578462 RepID=A0A0L0SXY8_ALLM3|nr:hypothetical protein AMAG_11829 [Allomyces macrogynus ATCC 38327]|eukprot:KNE67361.1 hypothetical protein AMAG_11829 [Allomyces macrogynus ATCC 38327]
MMPLLQRKGQRAASPLRDGTGERARPDSTAALLTTSESSNLLLVGSVPSTMSRAAASPIPSFSHLPASASTARPTSPTTAHQLLANAPAVPSTYPRRGSSSSRPASPPAYTAVAGSSSNPNGGMVTATSATEADLIQLREASLDAFQALVCRLVREAKVAAATPTIQPVPTSTASALASTSAAPRAATSIPPVTVIDADRRTVAPQSEPTPRTGSDDILPQSTSLQATTAQSLLQSLRSQPGGTDRMRSATSPPAHSSSADPLAIPSPASPAASASPTAPPSPGMSAGKRFLASLSRRRAKTADDDTQVSSGASSTVQLLGALSPAEVATPPVDDTAATSGPEGALALALAGLLEDVYTLLDLHRDPTPDEWAAVGASMHVVAGMCAARTPLPTSPLPATTASSPDSPLPSYAAIMDDSSDASTVYDGTQPPPPPEKHADALDGMMQAVIPGLSTKVPAAPTTPAAALPADLERVMAAIERLQDLGGRKLSNQCVSLSGAQEDRMASAATEGQIARLARGRLENQRAIHASLERDRVAEAVATTFGRVPAAFAAQRVQVAPDTVRRMELARLGAALDRLAERSRMRDQEAVAPKDRRIAALEALRVDVDRVAKGSALNSQRYTLSEDKERDMFLGQVLHRVSRLNGRRLDDQSADAPGVRKERAFSEVDAIMERMCRDSPKHDSQRYHVV